MLTIYHSHCPHRFLFQLNAKLWRLLLLCGFTFTTVNATEQRWPSLVESLDKSLPYLPTDVSLIPGQGRWPQTPQPVLQAACVRAWLLPSDHFKEQPMVISPWRFTQSQSMYQNRP